jgi:hypothetical protein
MGFNSGFKGLNEGKRLRTFKNRVLIKREEITDWRKFRV